MQTHWGDLPVSDAHVHFFSHRFFQLLGGDQLPLPEMERRLGWKMPPESAGVLAEAWTVELNRYGISRAILIASIPGDESSVEEAVTRKPERFRGYFLVNPLAPDAAVNVEAALSRGHLKGVALFPAMHRYPVYQERSLAVIEKAAARPGTIVFVHCGVLSVGVRKKLGLPSAFDMRFSNPLDLHAVALRFPDVNFVVPHFGAGCFREALMLCDLCPNVYLDTSSSNSWMRYEGTGPGYRLSPRAGCRWAGPPAVRHRFLVLSARMAPGHPGCAVSGTGAHWSGGRSRRVDSPWKPVAALRDP